MAASDPSRERIADFLLSHLNLYSSGACGPKREQPIDCFFPIHQSYEQRGGQDAAEWAFEAAIANETIYVAVEAFLDGEQGPSDDLQLLHRFGDYIDSLHPQPVTVTLSSIVQDMQQIYIDHAGGPESFSGTSSLVRQLHHFVNTRECFFYWENHAPIVEVAFSTTRREPWNLDINVHYSWSPLVIDFIGLRNTFEEDEEFILRPTIEDAAASGDVTTIAYILGPGYGWLHWDEHGCFRGVVPSQMASNSGAERLSTYSVHLELLARVTTRFPGEICFEKLLRVVVPLTVKRRASQCLSFGPGASCRTPTRPQRPMYRFPRSPPMKGPLRKDRLLHVLSLAYPPPGTTDVEVRTMHQLQTGDLQGDEPACIREEYLPNTPQGSTRHLRVRPQGLRSPTTTECERFSEVNLGSTHIDRRGKLASRSCSETNSPAVASPPPRNITPPTAKFLASPSPLRGKQDGILRRKRQFGHGAMLQDAANTHDPTTKCLRSPPPKGSTATDEANVTCGRAGRRRDSAVYSSAAREQHMTADKWQAAIQQNYKEFQEKKGENVDVTMQEGSDGDQELPSFQSDL